MTARHKRPPVVRNDLTFVVSTYLQYGTCLFWRDNSLLHGHGFTMVTTHSKPEKFLKLRDIDKAKLTAVACALFPTDEAQLLTLQEIRNRTIHWYLFEYYWNDGADRKYAFRFFQTLEAINPRSFKAHLNRFKNLGAQHRHEALPNFKALIARLEAL